jgi:outer membrane lipoprotein carrier protein
MFKIIFRQLCLSSLVVFSLPVFASTQQNAAAELTQHLNQFSTFQAHFSQVTTDAHNQLIQKSSGDVMLARPGRFRWQIKKPIRQLIITNGKTLWIYDADLRQATKQSVSHAPLNPAKLLSGDAAALVKQFTVRSVSRGDALTFQLTPKKESPQFRSIAISFEDSQLDSMKILNSLQQTNTFRFSNVVVNKSLPASLFEFTPPTDVDVMQ